MLHIPPKSLPARILSYLEEIAPLLLVFFAGAALVIVGTLRFSYFNALFLPVFGAFMAPAIAAVSAIVVEGTRLAFMLTAARDFAAKNWKGAAIGSLMSIGMVLYEIYESAHLAEYWTLNDPDMYLTVLGYLWFSILIAFFLEARLVLTSFTDFRAVESAYKAAIESLEKQLDTETLTRKAAENKAAKYLQEYNTAMAALAAKCDEYNAATEAANLARIDADALAAQVERLERRLAKAEKTTGNAADVEEESSSAKILATARELQKKWQRIPTQLEIATVLKIHPRTVRNHFPNGSLHAQLTTS
jgi:hypothetical protein